MNKIPFWELGKIGDKEPSGYLILEDDGSHSHWSIEGEWKYNCGGNNCISEARKHLESKNLVLNKNKMKITNLVKKILDSDTRKLVSAGFINGDLALTDEGVSELLGIIFLEKKAELVKIADEKVNEQNSK